MHPEPTAPVRIAVIGTRGIPNSHGGFERFVELLVDHHEWSDGKFRFVVFGEEPDRVFNPWTELRQVRYKKMHSPLRYYAKSAFLACQECDIVLCCGSTLSIFAFWVKWKSRLLVVNPDGCEWRRTKWPLWVRLIVRAMYTPTLRAADRVVIDAEALLADFGMRYGRKKTYIGYQAPEPRLTPLSAATRERLAIKRPFVLIIARLEPENNIRPALEAFVRLGRSDLECIVVAPTTTEHFRSTLAAFASDQIRFVGGIFDQSVLNELRGSCVAYVHGHSVGGTNPSLLEALATVSGVLLCHDNKYNREVAGDGAFYFANAGQATSILSHAIATRPTREPVRDARFHPDAIAARYRNVFVELLQKKSNGRGDGHPKRS